MGNQIGGTVMDWYLLIAVLLACGPPAGLILTEIELQTVRFQIVQDLKVTLFKGDEEIPQLELVMKRYLSARKRNADGGQDGKSRQDLTKRWTGALFYATVNFAGFALLIVPLRWLVKDPPFFPAVAPSAFWGAKIATEAVPGSVLVAASAFMGAFVFQLRYLIRATLNQELSALAFVRASMSTLVGVFVANIAYVAVSIGLGGLPPTIKSGSELGFAVVLAFFIGFWPDLGIAMVARWLKLQLKRIDTDCLETVRVIPLEVIDGIDTETSTRLQENNLYDVQNLATINPIELYAETPFTLFETFDWVIQAQLCTNVGCKAFQRLRDYNIRTIFDLERAILANDVPPRYAASIGRVLFADASEDFLARTRLSEALPAAGVDQLALDQELALLVRHAVAILCDDLHIHRLRKLWETIMEATGGDESWLYHPGALPGEGGPRTPPP
jgi:hypothetical protein